MSGKGFKSPLKERGQEQTQKHNDVETLEHKDMKRTTIYIPAQLARKLKAHAANTDQDVSGIITVLVEKYLDKEAD